MEYFGTNMDGYIISPLFLLLLIAGVVGVITFFFLLKFRKSADVKFWLVWQVAASIWAFTYAFEYAATNLETKIFWSKLSYFGIVYLATSFLFFSLAFSSNYKYLKKQYIIPLYLIATLFILSPYTNAIHHLHWRSYSITPETNTTSYVYGPLFWLMVLFTYAQLLGGIIVIFQLFNRLSGYYKRQVLLIFISALLPLFGNLIYIFHINPLPGFDWTPFSFLITGILIAINVSQFRMFDLVPFARNKLIDVIPDAIAIVDKSMRIADCNAVFAALINSTEKQVLGKPVDQLFSHRIALIQEVLRHDEFRTEISRTVDGEVQYFDLQINSLFDYKKQQSGRLVILKDITRRVNSEEMTKAINSQLLGEIQEKEKLIQDLDAFSHTVAHDLKGMLGAIASSSDLIRSAWDDMSKEDKMEVLELISQSATKTTHITKELLTLASVRQQEIKPVPVDLHLVSTEALFRLRDLINEKNAKVNLPEKWYSVLGNNSWVEEILINYFSNAIKYGGVPPEISVSVKLIAGNMVKYSVTDNGKGLSPEEIGLLFKKFSRLGSIRVEGHGLGLSIVKRIVEKLGGEVGVYSKNVPGEGCSFYFVLPIAN
ncbi:MAG TPA: histidine kinase N-terminal 7TM domain-containing protein [Prolixibacteraceae bacterium]|nr:histidine kinase N-terminal 7TM domain-containing protein [Prolixibacteraceae bacterium]